MNPYSCLLHPQNCCLLYTSDAADERSSVDLGGRRIIKKKKQKAHDEDSTLIAKQNQEHRYLIVFTKCKE